MSCEARADEIIDHTETDILDAVSEQVDLLLNLAAIEPDEFTALGVIRATGEAWCAPLPGWQRRMMTWTERSR